MRPALALVVAVFAACSGDVPPGAGADFGRALPDLVSSSDLTERADLTMVPDLAMQDLAREMPDLACSGGPALSVDPAMLDFGQVKAGFPSAPQRVVLRNTGNVEITISTITVSGANPNNFQLDNTPKFTLAPCQSKTFVVVYQPVARGSHSASLIFTPMGFAPVQVKLVGISI